MKLTYAFLLPIAIILLSCNSKNDSETNDFENLNYTIAPQEITDTNPAISSTDEINAEILKKYVVEDFIIQTLLKKPIVYGENGIISSLSLITRQTNNTYCIYNNQTHTRNLSFFENGKLSMKTEFLGREKNGEWITCYENGKVYHSEIYVEGSREGTWLIYYENGKVKSKTSYSDNKRHGAFEYYLNDGKIQSKAEYNNGVAVGNSFANYDNGKIEKLCSDELDERICKQYNEDGRLSQIVKYNLTGVIKNIIEYNEQGDISNERFFDENGKEINNNVVEKLEKNRESIYSYK
jgi:antitoxin component YwqK of YwqJK toxin-antitoxin module